MIVERSIQILFTDRYTRWQENPSEEKMVFLQDVKFAVLLLFPFLVIETRETVR